MGNRRSRKLVGQARKPGERLVSLFGDSITHGVMSANYVEMLAQRMAPESYHFMNAGVSGDIAYNMLQRLEPLVEAQPDAIVILVGTNDVQAYLRGGRLSALSQRVKKLPQAMTVESYSSLLRQIVLRFQHDTRAAIALCSIPALGEDLDAPANQAVRLFNHAVKALTDELHTGYLPVYETMEGFLQTQQHGRLQAFDEQASGKMLGALVGRFLLRRSWNDISRRQNFVLTTDLIHFNTRGATIIADQIAGWLHTHTRRTAR